MAEGVSIATEETKRFRLWRRALHDPVARTAVARRLERFQRNLFGDVKPVGMGVMEARIDVGPGYRLYYVRRGARLVLLLCGGDKRTQTRDISDAQSLAAELE